MSGQPAPGSLSSFFFDVTAMNISDPGNPSTTVIEAASPWTVEISFTFSGPGAGFMVGLPLRLTYMLRAESMGPEPEMVLDTHTLNTTVGQLNYGPGNPGPVPTFHIAANRLVPGAYKLVATVTAAAGGGPPPGIAGYVEGPIIQII